MSGSGTWVRGGSPDAKISLYYTDFAGAVQFVAKRTRLLYSVGFCTTESPDTGTNAMADTGQPPSRAPAPDDTEQMLACYRRMVLIRKFEEALNDLFSRNLLGGTSHFCIGQEACAVGVISVARDTDYLVSNHRGHGHLLARGLEPERVMAELMGKQTGYCGGRGGSQHMCAMDKAFLGTNGITGGGIPIATGGAYALKYKNTDRIVIAFFGDGASNQGTFHESLNMAALWKLPVLYVCENNLYGMSAPVEASTAGPSIAGRAAAYGITGNTCDGMDLLAIREMAAHMIDDVRSGSGPALLELRTYRYCGHSKNDPRVYRDREEEDQWHANDCLARTAGVLSRRGVEKHVLNAVTDQVRNEVDAAVEAAMSAPHGDRKHALGGVYA